MLTNIKNPTAYFLIGVPGSGKSTWVNSQEFDMSTTVVVSTDNYIQKMADDAGVTYDDMFDINRFKMAYGWMMDSVHDAISMRKTIVWDQTNLSIRSRKKKLNMLVGYDIVAVVFPTPDASEHARRLASRHGKTIPENVLASMLEDFEMPEYEEGFFDIRIISQG